MTDYFETLSISEHTARCDEPFGLTKPYPRIVGSMQMSSLAGEPARRVWKDAGLPGKEGNEFHRLWTVKPRNPIAIQDEGGVSALFMNACYYEYVTKSAPHYYYCPNILVPDRFNASFKPESTEYDFRYTEMVISILREWNDNLNFLDRYTIHMISVDRNTERMFGVIDDGDPKYIDEFDRCATPYPECMFKYQGMVFGQADVYKGTKGYEYRFV